VNIGLPDTHKVLPQFLLRTRGYDGILCGLLRLDLRPVNDQRRAVFFNSVGFD
jgi:hypothetical protein